MFRKAVDFGPRAMVFSGATMLPLLLLLACCGQNGSEAIRAAESEGETPQQSESEGEAEARPTLPDPQDEAEARPALLEPESETDDPQTGFLTREQRVDAPSHRTPPTAPHAILHGARAAERIVVFLHGWGGCARALAHTGPAVDCFEQGPSHAGWGLTAVHETAGDTNLLVIAQLSWLQRDGNPGRFAEAGFASTWLDALDAPGLPIVIFAHSAGFETALAILRHGDLGERIEAVVLFDALYSGTEGFVSWVRRRPGRRLISYYTGSTAGQNRRLRGLAERYDLTLGERPGPERILSIRTHSPHADVPIAHWQEALASIAPLAHAE